MIKSTFSATGSCLLYRTTFAKLRLKMRSELEEDPLKDIEVGKEGKEKEGEGREGEEEDCVRWNVLESREKND